MLHDHTIQQWIDPELLMQQREMILDPPEAVIEGFEPWEQWAVEGSLLNQEKGRQLMAERKCGCLLVAGGQGSRLGLDAPKGTFPVTLIQHKSLFQLTAERVLAASRQAGCALPLAIMTSELNELTTRDFFEQHAFFGLLPSQVDFFVQESLPLLDDHGNLFLESPGCIACGPDGNGGALQAFYRSAIWQKWFEQGVCYVAFIPVDNALADPFDAEFFGYHTEQGADATVKAIFRQDPMEKVGVLVQKQGLLHVLEYTEMGDDERLARRSNGDLKHPCANLSLFCFDMSFIERLVHTRLPLHLARKTTQTDWGERLIWKFERFIFDVLPYAKKTALIVYRRENCFAPLKNSTGPDSLQTVQKELLRRDRQLFFKATGRSLSEAVHFELSPQFYYPTPGLLDKLRALPFPPMGYIDAQIK